jgi:hypothetical protein
MKAVLKGMDSIEYLGNLDTYTPGENGVMLNVTLYIGAEESNAADNFDLFICSPEYIVKSTWEPRMGKGMMIVDKYDFATIKAKIKEIIEKCNTGKWSTTAENLSRYFDWEFEDFQPCAEEVDK